MSKKMSVFCMCLCSVICASGMMGITALLGDDSTAVRADASIIFASDYSGEMDGTSHCVDPMEGVSFKLNSDGESYSAYYNDWRKPKSIEIDSIYSGKPVTGIESSGFSDLRTLQSVTLPDTITDIQAYAFMGCTALKTFAFPESVETISYASFNGCSALKEIYLPENIKEIDEYAFGGCTSLKDIYYAGSEEEWQKIEIGENNGFENATIHFNYSVQQDITEPTTEAPQDLTSHCEENQCYLEYEVADGTATASYYMGYIPYRDELPTSITVPDTYDGYPVTALADCAFEYASHFETIEIPDTVQTIGVGAFSYATGLKSVTIPEGVTEIKGATFSYCESLETLNLPDSVTIIGASALYRCIALEEIHFPAQLKELGGGCCESCTSLKTVYLSDKLERIRSYAFKDSGLTDVYYDGTQEQWKTIQVDENNTVLENATIHFADGTTALVRDVTTITPAETQQITEPETEDLTNHCVPNVCDLNYRINGDTAEASEMVVIVEYPDELPKEIIVADTYDGYPVTSVAPNAFFEADFVESIILPDSIEKIGKYAFLSCHSLKEMHLPENLKTLEECAFMDCTSLKSVYISDKLESIGAECFDAYDTALTDVYYAGTEEQWQKIEIAGGNTALENATIHFNSSAPTEANAQNIGDIDGDGDVSVVDVLLLNKYLLGVAHLDDSARICADVDGNQIINDADSMNILKYVVKLIDNFESLKS